MIPGPNLCLPSPSSLFAILLQRTSHAASRNRPYLLRWLMSLGGLGIFVVSIMDSSMIPLPLPGSTDLLLLLLTSHRGSTIAAAIWLTACAFAGSQLGGYLCWSTGRKGGEVTLERFVPKHLLGRVTGWVERYGAWSVAVAAILPPPIPLTPFVLAAGALKVPRGRFMVAFAAARLVRYGLLAWLGVTYGRHFVRLWQNTLAGWTSTILCAYASLVAAGILYGIWRFRRASANRTSPKHPAEEPA